MAFCEFQKSKIKAKRKQKYVLWYEKSVDGAVLLLECVNAVSRVAVARCQMLQKAKKQNKSKIKQNESKSILSVLLYVINRKGELI